MTCEACASWRKTPAGKSALGLRKSRPADAVLPRFPSKSRETLWHWRGSDGRSRRFYAQHGPAVFQRCEAQANIESPRRIFRVATERYRIGALQKPVHEKRANSFATIGGPHSDAQFRRSLVNESVPRIGCRKVPQPGGAHSNTLNQRNPTGIAPSRSPALDVSRNGRIAHNRSWQRRLARRYKQRQVEHFPQEWLV